jgi:integrase
VKRNLLEWREQLLKEGKSAKTVADVYLACIRAIFTWAFENDRLQSNEAQYVRQEVRKKVRSREKGYTTLEAVNLLRASINYQPAQTSNPANRESAHITAAKRWAPLLCAFSGARITEITQMHKEDFREEDGRWIMRIRPEAGSVKQGDFRDVPLHRQLVQSGFVDFVLSAKPGPLFHTSYSRGKSTSIEMKKSARATSGRVGEWLNKANLSVVDVDPNHGFRHRFKTLGLELGLTSRVVDG